MIGPMKGTKRRTIESMPQSSGIGHADQPQADADRNAVGDVHDQLHQQVAADPLAGVAQRLGRPVQIAGADQPDEPVAQVLPLQQHEHDEDDDDARGRQRLDQRSDDGLQQLQRRRVGLRVIRTGTGSGSAALRLERGRVVVLGAGLLGASRCRS